MKPYYSLDAPDIKVYNADARDLSFVEDDTIPCVVTSPPYNCGIEYEGYDDNQAWQKYWMDLADPVCRELHRVMCSGGRSWINVAPSVAGVPDQAPGPHSGRTDKQREFLASGWDFALREAGLLPCDVIAWTSVRGSGTAWGSWQTPSAPNLRGDWEAILVHYKEQWSRTTPDVWKGWKDGGDDWTKLVSNVWAIQPQRRGDHPAPYPVEIPHRAIRLSTWPGEKALDPFMGSGTGAEAAYQSGRSFVGVEISEAYCEQTAQRLEELSSRIEMRFDT